MREILRELGLDEIRTDLLSDEERVFLQKLCDNYQLSESTLDKNDYKRKIKQFIKLNDNTN